MQRQEVCILISGVIEIILFFMYFILLWALPVTALLGMITFIVFLVMRKRSSLDKAKKAEKIFLVSSACLTVQVVVVVFLLVYFDLF